MNEKPSQPDLMNFMCRLNMHKYRPIVVYDRKPIDNGWAWQHFEITGHKCRRCQKVIMRGSPDTPLPALFDLRFGNSKPA